MKKLGLCKKGLIATLILTMTLTGCTIVPSGSGKDDNIGQANVAGVDNPSGSSSQGGSGRSGNNGNSGSTSTNAQSMSEVFSDKSFANRVVGNYYADTQYGDGFVVSIVNVYGNLYAYGGFVGEGEDSDIYSLWNMEIIPENPLDLYDENITKCDVGVLSFSIMSNLSQYWQAPSLGSIIIENDGIRLEGDPFYTGSTNLTLKRSDKVQTLFTYDLSSYLSEAGTDFDDSLYGIWRQKDTENPWYISFEKGDKYAETIIYKKAGGEEVRLSKGISATKESGTVFSAVSNLESDWSQAYEMSYKVSGDELVFTDDSGYLPFNNYDESIDEIVMERININDVPMVGLFEPDDLSAIKGEVSVDTPYGTREVCAHFKKSDDIENNGTEFVRVGNVVFFRFYDEALMDRTTAIWGRFREQSGQSQAGCVCYYDLRTNEYGLAFKDYGDGELYYIDGKFYSEHFAPDDYSSINYINCCYPDGSGYESHSDELAYTNIIALNDDNSSFAAYTFLANQLYIDSGDMYHTYCILDKEESILGAEFIDGVLYVVTYSYDELTIRLKQFGEYDEYGVLLGEFDNNQMTGYGYPSSVQISKDSNDNIYFGIAWVDGSNVELQDYYVVKATPDKEKSAKIIYNDIPDSTGIYTPYFTFNYEDSLIFSTVKPEGEVKLENGTYGDLIYADSAYGATLLIDDFIEEYPFNAPEG